MWRGSSYNLIHSGITEFVRIGAFQSFWKFFSIELSHIHYRIGNSHAERLVLIRTWYWSLFNCKLISYLNWQIIDLQQINNLSPNHRCLIQAMSKYIIIIVHRDKSICQSREINFHYIGQSKQAPGARNAARLLKWTSNFHCQVFEGRSWILDLWTAMLCGVYHVFGRWILWSPFQ